MRAQELLSYHITSTSLADDDLFDDVSEVYVLGLLLSALQA
jgi:hypothetical protein